MSKHSKNPAILLISALTVCSFSIITIVSNSIVDADIATTKLTTTNVFTNEQITNTHNRRFLAVGNFFDTTDGNYYPNSESYLKFNIDDILDNSHIISANLTLYRYANGGAGFNAHVHRLDTEFDGLTGQVTNDYRTKSDIVDSVYVDEGDYDFRAYSWNVTSIVHGWVNNTHPNYGFVLSGDGGFQSGAAFCSSRTDGFCTNEYIPKLEIVYLDKQPPAQPTLITPENNYVYSGNCDRSNNSGDCAGNHQISFRIGNLVDPDDDYESTTIYLDKTVNGINTTSQISGLTGVDEINHNQNISDGLYKWNAKHIDALNLESELSITRTFTIDTMPPNTPNISNIPTELNSQSKIYATETEDNLTNQADIRYKFQIAENSEFSNALESSWGETLLDLSQFELNDLATYFIRVKAKDQLNNVSRWSEPKSFKVNDELPVLRRLYIDKFKIKINDYKPLNQKINIYSHFSDENIISITYRFKGGSRAFKSNTFDLADNATRHNFFFEGKNSKNQSLKTGTYTIEAFVTDADGNISNRLFVYIKVDNISEQYRKEQEAKRKAEEERRQAIGGGGAPNLETFYRNKTANNTYGKQLMGEVRLYLDRRGKEIGSIPNINLESVPQITHIQNDYWGNVRIFGVAPKKDQVIGWVKLVIFYDGIYAGTVPKQINLNSYENYIRPNIFHINLNRSPFQVDKNGRWEVKTNDKLVPHRSLIRTYSKQTYTYKFNGDTFHLHKYMNSFDKKMKLAYYQSFSFMIPTYYIDVLRSHRNHFDIYGNFEYGKKRLEYKYYQYKDFKNKPFELCSRRSRSRGYTFEVHSGVDWGAERGCDVVAAGPGIVEYAGWRNGGEGNMVQIKHDNGTWTRYFHGNGVFHVSAGQRVKSGQKIMQVNDTGMSYGDHIHFELWVEYPWSFGSAYIGSVDPEKYLILNI